jgi:hypothetical protein
MLRGLIYPGEPRVLLFGSVGYRASEFIKVPRRRRDRAQFFAYLARYGSALFAGTD